MYGYHCYCISGYTGTHCESADAENSTEIPPPSSSLAPTDSGLNETATPTPTGK